MRLIMIAKLVSGLTLVLAATGAQAVAVSSITITGGTFSLGKPDTSATCTSATSNDSGSCHEIAFGGANTIHAGDTGTAKPNSAPFNPDIVHFQFFGQPATTGLAPTASSARPAADWANGFSGDASGGQISLNLGGFYFNWNGSNFLQGTDSNGANGTGETSTAAIGTIDGAGNFDIRWHSYMEEPLGGFTGYWHLTGTATLVPEASTYTMMLAGIGLVGGVVARRRGQR